MFAKKNNLVKTITTKNHIQKKKAGMGLQARQCLQNAHLIKKKLSLIITEEGVVLTNCVKS